MKEVDQWRVINEEHVLRGPKIEDGGIECVAFSKAFHLLVSSFLSSLLTLAQFDFCYYM